MSRPSTPKDKDIMNISGYLMRSPKKNPHDEQYIPKLHIPFNFSTPDQSLFDNEYR